MRNIAKLLMSFALVGFAACTNDTTEDLVNAPVLGGGKTTLTATIAEADVRTELGDKTAEGKYPLYWSVGDVVAVNGEAAEVTVREGDATLADFETSASAPYRVLYPYAEGVNPAHVLFADVQAYTEGTFAPASAPMYGYSEDTAIGMKHLTGILRFSVTSATARTLSNIIVTTDKAIAGEFALNFRTGEIEAVEDASSNTLTYTFAEGEGALSTTAAEFFVTLPAGEYGVVEALFTTTDGEAMTARFNGGTVKAGVVREFKTIDFIHNSNVFLIYDEATLLEFAAKVAANEFDYDVARVTASFAVSAETAAAWTPIEGFAGLLEGSDKVISGMTKPLFGTVKGHIRNLHFNSAYTVAVGETFGALAVTAGAGALIEMCETTKDATITVEGTTEGTTNVGGLVGSADVAAVFKGSINKAAIAVKVNNAAAIVNVGGIVGDAAGNITNCKNAGAISAVAMTADVLYAGGIVGKMETTAGKPYLIDYCENTGAMLFDKDSKANVAFIGGAIGTESLAADPEHDICSVQYVTNKGNIVFNGTIVNNSDVSHCCIGGVTGRGYSKYRYCYNGVEGNTTVGTIYVNGHIEAASNPFFAGIVGAINAAPYSEIYYSYNYAALMLDKMTTTKTQYLAGITCYKSDDTGDIRFCENNGPLTINGVSGTAVWLTGISSNCASKIVACTNTGKLTLNAQSVSAFHVCGIVGKKTSTRLYDGVNTADIEVNGVTSEAAQMFNSESYIGGCYGEGTQGIYLFQAKNAAVNSGKITVNNLVGGTKGKLYLGGVASYPAPSTAPCYQVVNSGDITVKNSTFNTTLLVGGIIAQTATCVNGETGVFDGTSNYVSNSGDIRLENTKLLAGNLYVAGCVCYQDDVDRMFGLKNIGNIYVDHDCSFAATVYVSGMFNYLVTDLALTAKPAATALNSDFVNTGNIYFNAASAGRTQIGGICSRMTEDGTKVENAEKVKVATYGRSLRNARNEGNIYVGVDPVTGQDIAGEQTFSSYLYVGGISAQHTQNQSGNFHNHGDVTVGANVNHTGTQCYVCGVCPYVNKEISTGTVENHGDVTFRGTTAASLINFAGCTGRTVSSSHLAEFINTGKVTVSGESTSDADSGLSVGGCTGFTNYSYGSKMTNSGDITVSIKAKMSIYVAGITCYTYRTKYGDTMDKANSNSGKIAFTGESNKDVFIGGIIAGAYGPTDGATEYKYFIKNSTNTGAIIAARPTCRNLFVGSIGGWVDGADDGSNTSSDDVRAITVEDMITGKIYFDGDACGKLYGLNGEYTDADGNIAIPGASTWS